jgi:predicted RNA-binding protein Jag
MDMGSEERKIISDIIKDNLKVAKESGMPFF